MCFKLIVNLIIIFTVLAKHKTPYNNFKIDRLYLTICLGIDLILKYAYTTLG